MMAYFDRTFWLMSLGFLILVLAGLGGVYVLNHWQLAEQEAVDSQSASGIVDIKP
jgi:hypothetical protein